MPDPILLTFVHISDTHISADRAYGATNGRAASLPRAEALVRQINALPVTPDFVLHTGDVAWHMEESAYATARDLLAQIRFPVYYLAGNHDDGAMLQRVMLGRSKALQPFHYQFEANGVQIVCLDSNGAGVEPPAGFVTEEQLEWLRSLCTAKDDDRPLVVAVHHNVLPVGAPWWDTYMRMSNGEDLHRALLPARHRLRGVFSGHVHENVDILRDGILYSSCASPWCAFHTWPGLSQTMPDNVLPPGFSVVTITQEQTFVRRWAMQVEG